ncbi:hypothetical protein FW778_12350 [Ginsengibacter hankyongi]|uniref:Uncharacterized protein n=1 Tax=Ginsengibacter hankyongi TaxID=2607284 RepID=A0A5J5II16_9BACT|nr:hypothetical protein [Ginsengibacter hankyongi]KAA9038357.1 hypothetical protein FW778_12350 [Ginsengibacter hankyongi]
MKLSSRILLSMLIILIAGLLLSNMVLKKEYNKIDKSDLHWNYTSVLTQPFKYLKIEGGNITKIAFEQNKNCSVRVLNDWQRYHPELIHSFVKNDTLFIKFVHSGSNQNEKDWMKWTTLVRIFSPELLSVEGFNTDFEMFKLKQKSISVNMSGKSKFEVESMIPDMDSINVIQKDSASVEFEMSPDYNSKRREDSVINKGLAIHFGDNTAPPANGLDNIKSDEAMYINSVNANLQGYSILDVGHAQIQSLQLNIADSSAIIMSGGALKKFK